MLAGLLWPVVMRKSKGRCQSCVFNVRYVAAVLKSVFPSPFFAHILSFAFLKTHLKRADKLFCELENFYANVGVSITVY